MFGSSADWYETAREKLRVWQSIISDRERNCNLGDVLLALEEWLIIASEFLLNSAACQTVSTKMDEQKFLSCFPLNVSQSDRGFGVWKCSRRYVTHCLTKQLQNGQSLSWKLPFRLYNNVFLIRQIELLSFSIDSVQQTEQQFMHTEWQSHLFPFRKNRQYTLWQLNHKWGVKNSNFLPHPTFMQEIFDCSCISPHA